MQKVASDRALARVGQFVCFAAAVVIPVLVLRRFAELEVSEPQLLIAVLATMSMALLCAVLGMLLEREAKRVC